MDLLFPVHTLADRTVPVYMSLVIPIRGFNYLPADHTCFAEYLIGAASLIFRQHSASAADA